MPRPLPGSSIPPGPDFAPAGRSTCSLQRALHDLIDGEVVGNRPLKLGDGRISRKVDIVHWPFRSTLGPQRGFLRFKVFIWFLNREGTDVCEDISAKHEYKAPTPGLVHNSGDWSGAFEAMPALQGA